jgi:uncharacterized protein YjbI with pentapeptide repeats/uncharacterized membrane protein
VTAEPERKQPLQKWALWVAVVILVAAVIIGVLTRSTLPALGAVLAAAGALIFTARSYRRAHQRLEVTQQRRVTGGHTKAIGKLIGKLDSKRLEARIGGVYDLERVALGSPTDHSTVMEVLAAFVREQSREKWPPRALELAAEDETDLAADDDRSARTTRPDVQAAITVIGRRNHGNDCRPVNLNRADLTAADLTSAQLADARLCAADLTNAHLINANLTDAKLIGANLTDAKLIRANLRGADLTNADLTGAHLAKANLASAHLAKANLASADVAGANLAGADFADAQLVRAHLTDANLRGANLCGADLTHADLRGANLANADLTSADLTHADLRGANLANAHLAGALWPRQSLMRKGLALKSGSRRLRRAGIPGDGYTRDEGRKRRSLSGWAVASGPRAHWVGVSALAALAAAAYSQLALTFYYTFNTASYDLVIFDQAVRSYAHFQPGISIMKGTDAGLGPHFSVLGDHWSPILAVLAPLYWIYNSPQTLLVAQGVLFALAIPPLWLFTRRAFGGGHRAVAAAYLVSVAYLLSWPVAAAVFFPFHEVAFAPVLTAVALERLQAGRLRTALIALAALLLVKEDMGLLVAGIGLYLAVARPHVVSRQRLVAMALIAAGIADSVLATYVLIPAFGGRSDYYWAYNALGSNMGQAALHLVNHPFSLPGLLITPPVKLFTMLWLFGAFCFLPLLSPISLAAIPLLLERMLGSRFPGWWGTSFQYNAFLVIVLACAAVDGAARLDRWVVRARMRSAARYPQPGAGARPAGTGTARRTAAQPRAPSGTGPVALGGAVALCAVAVLLVPRFAFGPALRPGFYHRDAQMQAAAAAVAAVPAGVTVGAVNYLGPQLSARDTVLFWGGNRPSPLRPPWVVADVARPEYTFSGLAQQKHWVALLEHRGYQVIFRRSGYIVLHREARARAGPSARSPG